MKKTDKGGKELHTDASDVLMIAIVIACVILLIFVSPI